MHTLELDHIKVRLKVGLHLYSVRVVVRLGIGID